MSNQIFAIIQTNRASLKKYISTFKKRKEPNESLIAPRPLPSYTQLIYYALIAVNKESVMHTISIKFRGFKTIDREEYEKEITKIRYSWNA